jgi:hypothetical protein
MPWSSPFDDPIPLPRDRQLVTLEDAGNFITKLSKAVREVAEWQAAMEALILVATHGGPTMFARIGVMRALNHGVESVFNSDRKDTHWGKRKLARDRRRLIHVARTESANDLRFLQLAFDIRSDRRETKLLSAAIHKRDLCEPGHLHLLHAAQIRSCRIIVQRF